MTMTVLDPALAAGDAGQVSGERQGRPDPEVPERAGRRTFTAAYKQEILAAYDAAPSGPSAGCSPPASRPPFVRKPPAPPALPGASWINPPQEKEAAPQ
jgi:hypothetical protein